MADWLTTYEKFRSTPWTPTKLAPKEEKEFQKWLQGTQLFSSVKPYLAQDAGVPLEKLSNEKALKLMLEQPDYDYRGAWKAGVKEVISPYDNRPHWPSATPEGRMLKDPNHPTAWKEFFMQQYGEDPDALGLDTYEKARMWHMRQTPTMSLEPAFMYKDPFGAPD
jgi:hypothetical protein